MLDWPGPVAKKKRARRAFFYPARARGRGANERAKARSSRGHNH